MREWIDTKDVARMIRADLKAQLPGVKFIVRIHRYAGGSSVDVRFKYDADDNNTSRKIAAEICERYEGKGFDGMTDSSYYIPVIIDGEEYITGCYVFLNSARG